MTGDLVEETPEGALRHLGRADDILNPGGFRVAPQEVEVSSYLVGQIDSEVNADDLGDFEL